MQKDYQLATQKWPPFWKNIPNIFMYPLRGSTLITIAVLVALQLMSHLPFFGILFYVFAVVAGMKFALQILRDTADGYIKPPEFGIDLNDGIAIFYIFLILVCLSIFGFLSYFARKDAAMVFAVFCMITLPAIAISLAVDETSVHAIKPSTWARIISVLGLSYLFAVALLLVSVAFAGVINGWLAQRMPPLGAELFSTVVTYWSLFAGFHLLGYLVYQYQDELGFTPTQQKIYSRAPANRDLVLMEQVESLLEKQDLQGATELLLRTANERAMSEKPHLRLRELLLKQRKSTELLEHDRRWLHQLVLEKQHTASANLARETLSLDPTFAPIDDEDLVFVLGFAENTQQSGLTRDCLNVLVRVYPQSRALPLWCTRLAQIESERFGNPARAQALLGQAQARTSDPSVLEEISRIRAQLPPI